MSKPMTVNGSTMVVTDSSRTKTARTVHVHFPNVAPPGADWVPGHPGRHFVLTSIQGGTVALYCFYPKLNAYIHEGTVRNYAPGQELQDAFKAAWVSEQPSAAALKSFEASVVSR